MFLMSDVGQNVINRRPVYDVLLLPNNCHKVKQNRWHGYGLIWIIITFSFIGIHFSFFFKHSSPISEYIHYKYIVLDDYTPLKVSIRISLHFCDCLNTNVLWQFDVWEFRFSKTLLFCFHFKILVKFANASKHKININIKKW